MQRTNETRTGRLHFLYLNNYINQCFNFRLQISFKFSNKFGSKFLYVATEKPILKTIPKQADCVSVFSVKIVERWKTLLKIFACIIGPLSRRTNYGQFVDAFFRVFLEGCLMYCLRQII